MFSISGFFICHPLHSYHAFRAFCRWHGGMLFRHFTPHSRHRTSHLRHSFHHIRFIFTASGHHHSHHILGRSECLIHLTRLCKLSMRYVRRSANYGIGGIGRIGKQLTHQGFRRIKITLRKQHLASCHTGIGTSLCFIYGINRICYGIGAHSIYAAHYSGRLIRNAQGIKLTVNLGSCDLFSIVVDAQDIVFSVGSCHNRIESEFAMYAQLYGYSFHIQRSFLYSGPMVYHFIVIYFNLFCKVMIRST